MATQNSSSPAKKARLGKWGIIGGLIAFVFALGFIGNLFTQGGIGSTGSGTSGNIIPLLMLFALLIFSFVLKGWKRALALVGIVTILLSPLLLKPSIKTVAQGYGIGKKNAGDVDETKVVQSAIPDYRNVVPPPQEGGAVARAETVMPTTQVDGLVQLGTFDYAPSPFSPGSKQIAIITEDGRYVVEISGRREQPYFNSDGTVYTRLMDAGGVMDDGNVWIGPDESDGRRTPLSGEAYGRVILYLNDRPLIVRMEKSGSGGYRFVFFASKGDKLSIGLNIYLGPDGNPLANGTRNPQPLQGVLMKSS